MTSINELQMTRIELRALVTYPDLDVTFEHHLGTAAAENYPELAQTFGDLLLALADTWPDVIRRTSEDGQ